MAKVFISYSRTDLKFVEQLAADLTDAGLDIWYDLSGLEGGDQWAAKIQEAIRSCEKFILIVSQDSIESKWVLKEFLYASNLGMKIVPLLYRKFALPLWLQDIHFIDVQGKKYQQNFNEILRALGTEITQPNHSHELERLESQAIQQELKGDFWHARKTWYQIKRIDPLFPRVDIKINEMEKELQAERSRTSRQSYFRYAPVIVVLILAFIGLGNIIANYQVPMHPAATETLIPSKTPKPTETPMPTITSTQPPVTTKTPVLTATYSPTITPTGTPSITPTPGFALIAIDEIVYRGGEASATIRTTPNTYCTLTFFLPSGTMSNAAGVGACTTDEDGLCTWTWDIRSNVNPGYGNIVIIVGEQQESFPIEIR